MSRWPTLGEGEPCRPWAPRTQRLARLQALCARWNFGLQVIEVNGRLTTVALSAYGQRHVMGLRDAEFAVSIWICDELAEYRARRSDAGYPPVRHLVPS